MSIEKLKKQIDTFRQQYNTGQTTQIERQLIESSIVDMFDVILEFAERLDTHRDSIRQNNNAICHILTKPDKSKWVWNQERNAKVELITGKVFEVLPTGKKYQVVIRCFDTEGWKMALYDTEDEVRAYIDEITEGI